MSKSGKDSPEVVNFMTRFEKLKNFSDDAPAGISSIATSDSSVNDLCMKLWFAAQSLKENEQVARSHFAAPVDPAFLAAWRDYEKRYESVISGVLFADQLPELGSGEPSLIPRTPQWDNADDEAREQASGIKEALGFAKFNADQDFRWNDQPDFIERVQDGIAAWDRLEKATGFDLRGVFRRRALVPFVLVPRLVSNRNGSTEKLSMLKNLQQAYDAFVFGVPYAAVALMRSIMEAVLRDHYRAEGSKEMTLKARILDARDRLPPEVREEALVRLLEMANDILHLGPENSKRLPKMDEVRLEKEIVSLLFVLRALIEGVKR
ncbi:MAG: hypothetical protein HQL45_10215 [Alphaproteobacteria bacterium]|nr:hypothetical protein [Alphaproteobacteria bacterium]